MSCHDDQPGARQRKDGAGPHLVVGLAGNANVGKSVVFNQLTGLHQHVGNWPGKTVKKAEGTLVHDGYVVDVVDLPGIYSLSTYGTEERVTREYVVGEHPNAIVNVVDASSLERNLFFTTQLMELEPHLIVALNQVDAAEKKGIKVDASKLSQLLGVPVVPTTATRNIGLTQLMAGVVSLYEEATRPAKPLTFGPEIENIISNLVEEIREVKTRFPGRWVAIRLLEGDPEMEDLLYSESPSLREWVEDARKRIENIHGHDVASVLVSERYAQASRIASEVTTHFEPQGGLLARVEDATSHPVLGYVILTSIILGMFYSIFRFGDAASGSLDAAFAALRAGYLAIFGSTPLPRFIWDGLLGGLFAATEVALPYIVPFYVAISVLEDSGYLARAAFLMDSLMHRIGLHGKGFIPMMLGLGCNVPAVLASSVMETDREKLICAFVSTLVPCAARTVVIMGVVAAYLGFGWAVALYAIDFMLIFLLGRIAFKALPGEPLGLVMEMPSYKVPSAKATAQRTWFSLRGFVFSAFPIMVAGNLAIYLASALGVLNVFSVALSPVTVVWLGLPAATGVLFVFGVLRKEAALILLASVLGTSNFALVLSPAQMLVFAFVIMVYVPCLATIGALTREFGVGKATLISVTEVGVAISLGGILLRVLFLLGVQ